MAVPLGTGSLWSRFRILAIATGYPLSADLGLASGLRLPTRRGYTHSKKRPSRLMRMSGLLTARSRETMGSHE